MASLQHIAPIFPTADMDAMRAHYEALGFTVHVHGGGYGTAARDAIRIHFKLVPDMGPATRTGCRLPGRRRRHGLHAEWRAAAVGETSDLFDPGFGVWRRPTPTATGTCCASAPPSRPDLDARPTRCGDYTCPAMKAIASDLLLT